MPMIQNAITRPWASRGGPLRASSSARAWASASSSVTSASWVIAAVISASDAACSTSRTASRSSTTWRATRIAEPRLRPSACKRAIKARMVSASGVPAVSSVSSPNSAAKRRRTRCTKRLWLALGKALMNDATATDSGGQKSRLSGLPCACPSRKCCLATFLDPRRGRAGRSSVLGGTHTLARPIPVCAGFPHRHQFCPGEKIPANDSILGNTRYVRAVPGRRDKIGAIAVFRARPCMLLPCKWSPRQTWTATSRPPPS